MSVQAQRVPPAYDGMNTEASPDYVGSGEAPLVENLLPRPGKLVMRGPFRTSTAGPATGFVEAIWSCAFTGQSLMRISGQASGKVWASTAGEFTPGGHVVDVADLQYPSTSHAEIMGKVYGYTTVGYFSSWNGTSTITAYTNGPHRGYAIASHLNRLFALGGVEPGTPPSSPVNGFGLGDRRTDVLYWSDQLGTTLADNSNAWQDDVSGLVNKITFDSRGDTPIGLASTRDGLVAFYRGSIFIVRGKTPASFSVECVSRELGCVNQQSIVAFEDGVAFASDRGYMYFDGAQLIDLSADKVRADVAGRHVVAASLEADWLCLVVHPSATAPTSGSYTPSASYLLHLPTRRWIKLSSAAMTNGMPLVPSRRGSTCVLWDGTRLWSVSGEVTQPSLASEANRGRDYNGTTYYAIAAKWYSKLQRLGSPSLMAQVQRVLLDYLFVPDGAAAEQSGWYVKIVDGQGSTLFAETQVPAQLDPPTQLYRRRYQTDCFAETVDAQVRIEWRSSASPPPALASAEIYDAVVEYQAARKRPSA